MNGMTRREREVTDIGEIIKILDNAKVLHLGMVDGDEPYVVPMNYGYTLENGNKIYIIAEGRLVNLAAGDGHPAEIMDMSFAIQALSARYLALNSDRISREPGCMVNDVPLEIDQEVARRKLSFWGCEIDTLTPEQHKYLFGE